MMETAAVEGAPLWKFFRFDDGRKDHELSRMKTNLDTLVNMEFQEKWDLLDGAETRDAATIHLELQKRKLQQRDLTDTLSI